jgi:hypothetical protein
MVVENTATVTCSSQQSVDNVSNSDNALANIFEVAASIQDQCTAIEQKEPGIVTWTITLCNTSPDGKSPLTFDGTGTIQKCDTTGQNCDDPVIADEKTIIGLELAAGECHEFEVTRDGLLKGKYTDVWTGTATMQAGPLELEGTAMCNISDVPEKEYFVGGGKILMQEGEKQKDNVYLTHGFQLHCDDLSGPNNLEVNWDSGEGRFHLEELEFTECNDDGSVNEPPPSSDTSENGPGPTTDVYYGFGFGRVNGVCGGSAEWVFDDNGEPGKLDHIVAMRITDADGDVQLNLNEGELSTRDTSSAGSKKVPATADDPWYDLITGNHQWTPHQSEDHGPLKTAPCPEVTPNN